MVMFFTIIYDRFVITQFWVIPKNSLSSKIKTKKIKIKASNMEKAGQKEFQKYIKKQTIFF